MEQRCGRVLVVEDEEVMIRFVAGTLASVGYAVTTARNGFDAIRLLRDGLCKPDLVVLDLNMPRMDGVSLLRKFRERSESAHTPVIILSAHFESERKVACLEQGANDYVVKPVAGTELIARVDTHIRVHHDAEEWRRNATVDALTGLLNRRGLEERLAVELVLAERSETDLSVIFFDLNHFKQLNDRFGHAYGDDVLSRVGKVVAAAVRNTDLTARWGGDEFIVVCPGMDRAGAKRVVREIQWLTGRDIHSPRFGIAAGICCLSELPNDARTPDMLIALADREMYRYKTASRSSKNNDFELANGTGRWRREG